MIDIRTPVIYRTKLISKELTSHLFDWTFEHPPAPDTDPIALEIYYRHGLDSPSYQAMEWAKNQGREKFRQGYEEHGFVHVATAQMNPIIYDETWKIINADFMSFLVGEENKHEGRYFIALVAPS